MTKPLIGVTTGRRESRGGYPLITVVEAYTQALSAAGAIPLLIPLGLPDEDLTVLPARLDGIVFTGGGDLQPERYGSGPHPLVNEVDPDRDRVELTLVEGVVETGLPFLGICRGLQVINAGLGGSLYEDVLEQRPGALQHRHWPGHPRSYLAHPVRVEAGSCLAGILGLGEIPVNSLHHQGIRNLSPGLRASAFAPDGLVEAIELPGARFGLAVQWHPEWLQEHAPMRGLFRSFVLACEDN